MLRKLFIEYSSNRKMQPTINYVSILWYNNTINFILLYNYTNQINKLLLASLSMFNFKFLSINYLVLSGIFVRSFSMKMYSCWIKIYFSSNPESFQILADEIVNS